MSEKKYLNPLVERYASDEMNYIFSPFFKFTTWRKLWLYLAEAEKKAGLKITARQLAELRNNIEKIDFKYAARKEKELRHDVMAHVHTFARQCPAAAPIIHLGATSAYVGDNTDLIQLRDASCQVRIKLKGVMKNLRQFAFKYRKLPTLAFTHFQPAQLTTVGKRACLWLQELLLDCQQLDYFLENLAFRGVKGTTGTQASFMSLFNNNQSKVEMVNNYVTRKCGFKRAFTITGQTYTRKVDHQALSVLSGIAQSAAKFANDLRLLQHKKEMEEPFGKKQIGSSAMAYKRNPMRSERIGSLARFVMSLTNATAYTASTQWFERTLDDSANKRLAVCQAFLAVDAILDIYANITSGMVVYKKIIERNLKAELPFMITENILMQCVKKGGDRQQLHEKIRQLSMRAGAEVKEKGKKNNLCELIAADPSFRITAAELEQVMDPAQYIGRSVELTEIFLTREIDPVVKKVKAVRAALKV